MTTQFVFSCVAVSIFPNVFILKRHAVLLRNKDKNTIYYRRCNELTSSRTPGKAKLQVPGLQQRQVKFILQIYKTKVGSGGKRRKTLRSSKGGNTQYTFYPLLRLHKNVCVISP